MKQRFRFGVRVRLPFNIFPNAAIFVLNLNAAQSAALVATVRELQGVIELAGYPDIAARLFAEESK